jgi:hypothetical protein
MSLKVSSAPGVSARPGSLHEPRTSYLDSPDLSGATMTKTGLSLFDILVPPGNPWLCRFLPGKTDLPKGVRVVRHCGGDDDTFDRNERLRASRRKLN